VQLKKNLRKRPFAAAACFVPLLVIIYHAIVHGLGGYWSVPPQYDMLYMTNYADGAANGLSYEIKDNQLRFYYRGDNYGYGWPRLFRFNPASGRYREIRIHRPPSLPQRKHSNRPFKEQDANHLRPVPIAETDQARVIDSLTAPDGAVFERFVEGREDFHRLFSNDRSILLGYVNKAGKHYPLRAPPGPRTKDNVTFIGWVVS
jgi:hypothetical protein